MVQHLHGIRREHVVELLSYRVVTPTLQRVLKSFCLLLERPPDIFDRILFDPHFLRRIMSLHPDDIPDETLVRLGKVGCR